MTERSGPNATSDLHADGPPHGEGGLRRCVLCDEVWPCSAILSERARIQESQTSAVGAPKGKCAGDVPPSTPGDAANGSPAYSSTNAQDVTLPFTAPADGYYRIDGKEYRLGAGTTVDKAMMPNLDPWRGCICSLGYAGSNPECQAFHPVHLAEKLPQK